MFVGICIFLALDLKLKLNLADNVAFFFVRKKKLFENCYGYDTA